MAARHTSGWRLRNNSYDKLIFTDKTRHLIRRRIRRPHARCPRRQPAAGWRLC